MRHHLVPYLAALAAAAIAVPARADFPAAQAELSVAAAANLVYALDAIDAAFEKAESGVTVTSATGASGSLVAQIEHGAPYDVFLSADADFPKALIKAGQADAGSFTEFAVGRLVLWTTKAGLDVSDVSKIAANPSVQRLAIANVLTAPFGRAAKEALQGLGEWDAAQPKLVVGENISQTAEFVATGNADAGFVALSIVVSPKLKEKGRWVEVPAGLYGPLAQCAVVTAHGVPNPEAARYVAFLRSAQAQEILKKFGYGMPPGP